MSTRLRNVAPMEPLTVQRGTRTTTSRFVSMINRPFFVMLAAVTLLVTLPASAQESNHSHDNSPQQDHNVAMAIPPAMATEHEDVHAELAAIIAAGGKTGQAARKVEAVLAPHFEEENRYALPPLGLLPALAQGHATPSMCPAIDMAMHVERSLERFKEEHANVVRALDELELAAKAEHRSDALQFAADLRGHAAEEEQVSYPTTILIGRYLKLVLKGCPDS